MESASPADMVRAATAAPSPGYHRRGQAPDVAPDAVLDDLVRIVISECLDHFCANREGFRQDERVEHVHQMRVGLRRMRTALAMFNKALPSPEIPLLRAEAGRIASGMGRARDTDVFIRLVNDGPLSVIERDESFEALLEAAETRRKEAYRDVRELVDAARTSQFVQDVQSFMKRHGWRSSLGPDELPLLTRPAEDFAADILAKLDSRALRRSHKIRKLEAEQRHDLRILLKKIRYTSEFVSAMFPRKQAAKYVRAAADLQDVLGAYNDAIVAEGIIAELENRAGPASARAAGLTLGWCKRGSVDADAFLAEAVAAFRSAPRFWT